MIGNVLNAMKSMTSGLLRILTATVVESSKPFARFAVFLAAMLIGSLATSIYLLQPLPAPVSNDQQNWQTIYSYKAMVARDKRIIDSLLMIDWDRNKPIKQDCEKVNFCWTEIDSCRYYQEVEK